jgi:hypothetical protein
MREGQPLYQDYARHLFQQDSAAQSSFRKVFSQEKSMSEHCLHFSTFIILDSFGDLS